MIKKPRYLPNPEGSNNKIFTADLAEEKTSRDLVNDSEPDSYFFRELEEKGINLNLPQIKAVRHGEGSALVLAGAGSGKTRVLTARTGYLLAIKKINPKNIMLVTFSKKAAGEIKERIEQMPGLTLQTARSLTTGTFHSIFWRLLKSKGYTQQVLHSDNRKQLAIKLILKDKKLQDAYDPETLLAILSSYKNNAQTAIDLPSKTTVEKEIRSILVSYEQWKQENNFFDFDDMLLEAYHLLLSDPVLLKAMQTRFRYILCDEWQDTNPLQYQLIKMISKPENNLFVVGDDDQTIYSFNGADQSIIMDFKKQFADAAIITLDVNYRSTASILGIANQVISRNSIRNKKVLKATKTSNSLPSYLRPSTTDEEAKILIEQINKLVREGNRRYSDIAILHRTASNSRAIMDELVRTRIPFISYTKGETFYEQAQVKPVIDYLRLSLDPDDLEAIRGIAPTLYINRDKAIQHIQQAKLKNNQMKSIAYLSSLSGLQSFQKRQLTDRVKLIASLSELSPVKAVQSIRTFYDHFLETNERKNVTLHKDMIRETLAEIESAAKRFDSVADFLTFINNVITRNKEMSKIQDNPHADTVSLMTIHRAKGLEFPVVFLIGASETILPHSSSLHAAEDRKDPTAKDVQTSKLAALEEERRLTYVAITRAKDELYVSSPSYYRGEPVEISRFIMDSFLPEDEQTQKDTSSSKKEKLLVWQCTAQTCICWMRISNSEEAYPASRECPMCKSLMKKNYKII